MKKQKLKRQIIRTITSYLLIASMCAPNITPVVSYAAEYVNNRPRYVDFTRPEALTLADLDLTEATPAEPSKKPQADLTEESSASPEQTPETNSNGQTTGSGGKNEVPSSVPKEEPKAATPSDAELREPENWHDISIDEPEGRLVRFTDDYRIYEVGEGEYITVFGGYSGLYLNEDGEVEPVDNTLEETMAAYPLASSSNARYRSAGFPAYKNHSGKLSITIPEKLSTTRGIAMEYDDARLELVPAAGNFKHAVVADNAVRYNSVFENVDYQYTIVGESLKEDIILLEKQERNEFSYKLKVPGLKAALRGNEIIVYKAKKEEPVFILTAPFMEDADGSRSQNIRLSLTGENGIYTVKAEADRKWLDAEERVYPVRIDPTPSLVPPDQFIFVTVSEGTPTTHYQWDDTPYVGYLDGGRGNTRVYIAVNAMNNDIFNAAMAGAKDCTQAVFKVTTQTNNSDGKTVFLMSAPERAWDSYTLTWQRNPGFNKRADYISRGNAPGAGNTIEFDITAHVRDWTVNALTHFGLVIKADIEPQTAEQIQNYKMPAEALYNRNDAVNGPKLEIRWTGVLPDPEKAADIDSTTLDVCPAVIATEANEYGRTVTGLVAHGVAQAQADVNITLYRGDEAEEEEMVKAQDEVIYPDFIEAKLKNEADRLKNSNWQGKGYPVTDLDLDTIYGFDAYATGQPLDEEGNIDTEADPVDGKRTERVHFLLYRVKQDDLVKNIAKHYGVNPDTIAKDNKLFMNQLTEMDTILFIREPETARPYRQGTLDPFDKFVILCLKAGKDPACVLGLEPVNLNTGSFYMEQMDAELPELSGTFGIERTYNSILAEYGMEFGMGWSSPFGEHLTLLPDGRILYHRADGKGMPFERDGENYRAPAGYDGILEPMDTLDIDTATRSNASRKDENEEVSEPEEMALVHAAGKSGEDSEESAQNPETGGETPSEGEEPEPDEEEGGKGFPATAGWKLTNRDGSVHVFDAMGFLRYTEDLKGRRTLYVYDDDYKLLQVVTPTEKVFNFTMNEDRLITEVGLPDGGTISYEYDEEMNLISVTDPEGYVRRYEYDEGHRMTAWFDENGNRVTANEYDDKDRVVEQTDALGSTAYLNYQEGSTVVTDNRGNVTTYHYDEQFRTTKISYPDGSAVSRTYGDDGNLASEKDELGNVTAYTYDENGNMLSVRREDGSQASYTYNEQNLPLTATDFEGNTTTFTYDGLGNLLSVTDGEGNTTSYRYDELHRMTAITDGNGAVTRFAYDGAVPVSYTDGEGHTCTFTYDEMNRQLSASDPAGNSETYEYDRKGRKISETAKDGGTTLYEFDPAGCVLSITDAMGVKTDFTYDKMYNIISGKDALGNTLTYGYDENYNKISETDAKGNTTTYTYDSRDRLVKVTDALGNDITCTLNARGEAASITDRLGNVTKTGYHKILGVPVSVEDALGNISYYRYDKNGNVTKAIYPDGSEISYSYDKAGRIVTMTAQNGLVTSISYDGNGNIIQIKDDETRVYTFEYDLNNRLVRTADPLGGVTEYVYDEAGNQISMTDANENTTGYAYDAVGRLEEVRDALGGVVTAGYDLNGRTLHTTDQNGHKTSWHYDVIGQVLAEVDAAGNITAMEYDSLGNVEKITDALKGETAMAVDALNRTVKMTDALGGEYEYTYDENGNLLKVTMPDKDTVTMTYDALNRMVSSQDEAGVITTYEYDSMGRIIKAADTAGNQMTYEYDVRGSLIKQTDTIGRSALYEYDRFGRLISVTGTDLATTTYTYDALDRLTSVTKADGTVTAYEYDPVGNLIQTTEPGEAVYTYTYDAINRLTGKVNPLGAATTFQYDAKGNLTQGMDGEGNETAYVYDAIDRLTAFTDGRGNGTSYEYDELSRLLSLTTPEGNKSEYRYDALGRMTKAKDPNGLITEYRYDVMGNLVEAISPKGAKTSYTYDKHDEVTSITDPAGNVTGYTVDMNRLVTELTEKNGAKYQYTYDAVHRLTGITTPLGLKRELTYDVADNVIRDTDSLERTNTYEYDIMHRMTKSVNAEGGITTYGYDIRGNRSELNDALGYTWNYQYDLVDQLTASVDPEGKATEFVYNLAGELASVTKPGGRTTSFRYDGNYNVTDISDPKGYIYSYVYDKDNRLAGTENPLGEKTATAYDPGSRITSVTDRMGLTESYAYDPHGNILSVKATNGLITRFTYDILDNLIQVVMPSNLTAAYTYDAMGNVTSATDTMKRVTKYTYDAENNLTSIIDPMGRKETFSYDAGGRRTGYTSNGGNQIHYDYDRLNDLVEKSYEDSRDPEGKEGVIYGYDVTGQRISMMDRSGESKYEYDGLGRITKVTTGSGEVTQYAYDGSDQLESITYPDGKKVSYEYDKNDNLTKVTDRTGAVTSYVYDAINRLTEIHRPNGVSTYNTYNARDQITDMKNICDDCEWVVSEYHYTYDDRGFIVGEDVTESLYAYAWDDKHDGKHENGRHDDLYPHGGQHINKHDKDGIYNFQIIGTKRTFEYDEDGKLIKATENEDRQGTYVYEYEYDAMGNRTLYKKSRNGKVQESAEYTYNMSNQMVAARQYDGKHYKNVEYTYDADGNRVLQEEIKDDGTRKVELSYDYSVENRLKAVSDKKNLLAAMAYDGDGNRIFQLNYNLHTDDDWKGNSGNGNGNNKDNSGSGNSGTGSGNGNENENGGNAGGNGSASESGSANGSGNANGSGTESKGILESIKEFFNGGTETEGSLLENAEEILKAVKATSSEASFSDEGGSNGNKNKDKGNDGNDKNNGKGNGNKGNSGNNGNANGNTNNTGGSQNQSGILFPIDGEVSELEEELIGLIKTTGKEKNYELVEYVNDVNREYTEVLMELNINGIMDTSYSYGTERLTNERFTGWTGYYTYDPRGSVSGVTDSEGMIWQSYRYDINGDMTFGKPQYNNVYGYNAESYNPNFESQYLRARYYNVPNGNFLTEDSYLGNITDPLTLNRYNYAKSSPLNYIDPSGDIAAMLVGALIIGGAALVGGAISGGVNAYHQKKTTGEISAKETVKAAGKGAIIGGVAGATGMAGAAIGGSLALGAMGTTAATATVGEAAAAGVVGSVAGGAAGRAGGALTNNVLAKDENELVDVKTAVFDKRAAVVDAGLGMMGSTAPMWAGGKSSTALMNPTTLPTSDLTEKANLVKNRDLLDETIDAVDDGTALQAGMNQAAQSQENTVCEAAEINSEGGSETSSTDVYAYQRYKESLVKGDVLEHSNEIISGDNFGDKNLINELTKDGSSISDWSKMESQYSYTNEYGTGKIHYYKNTKTGVVSYYDAKMKISAPKDLRGNLRYTVTDKGDFWIIDLDENFLPKGVRP